MKYEELGSSVLGFIDSEIEYEAVDYRIWEFSIKFGD